MTTIRIKLPKIEQVDFLVIAEVENIPVRGNAIVSGDDKYDKEVEDKIISDLERNCNEWAWCCVRVCANWKELEYSTYLGGCSYGSKVDFINNSGYYESMKTEAYEGLIEKIKSLAK